MMNRGGYPDSRAALRCYWSHLEGGPLAGTIEVLAGNVELKQTGLAGDATIHIKHSQQ